MIIAIDFDGTLVEDEYPRIGKPKLFAFETLKEMKKRQHTLILWTTRQDELLQEAVDFCQSKGIVFDAVNESYPGERLDENTSRKPNADLFIDKRNIGGIEGWSQIWQRVNPPPGQPDLAYLDPDAHHNFPEAPSLFEKLKKIFRP